ncbi:nucleotidyltransferase domain-containing protein [Photobacterium kishitanii]|nr:nucleotidyltransferase domain-containing protein [Photobacterium kishitanii]
MLRNNWYASVREKIEYAFVIGSVAKGTNNANSDLDIAIIIPTKKRISSLKYSERYHNKFPDDKSKPHWHSIRVDFQFFYEEDPQLDSYSKIEIQ